ncbi:2Fe-2S iron-sulfur cluster-binding protein [Mycolicibacterium helvum]|uniref:Oxidoreductase n=1 Tax=Mycolicibacterium helvum TaxID=1534349 RepID=A0A7I7T9B1_9MYCO|nr:2Fe-2S iron-sulfur cluster-binding protein [Mycolicibacterium helvum]BBY65039.1 hypothetical protein MHEL_32820 [Mycolicibacterium helvum]
MTIKTQALHRLTTVDEVETIIGRPPAVVLAKELDHLDDGCREILAHSPIAGIGYLTGPDARPVSTFIGGAPGFAEMLDPNTISVPVPDGEDPPQQNTGISFVFLLPGVGEVLRLNGRVSRSSSTVEIKVQQAFVHCAKAIHRSGLWGTPEPPKPGVGAKAHGGESRTLDDPAIADFFAACPFLVVSTWAGDLSSDTSPRGDSIGFVQILDANTVAIPDRKGNKRADTFHNLVENDRISLAAVIPGSDLALHLHGTGYMSDDSELLATMEIKGAGPHAALIIKVTNVEIRTNTAILKSDLWHLDSRGDEMPNMMALASQHVVIMTSRSEKRSALGAAFALLAKYPRLAKAVADLTYRSELTGEGYAAPGSAPEVHSPSGIETAHASGGWFRRLLTRLRLTPRPATDTAMGLRDVKVVDVIRETAAATTLVFEDPSGSPFEFKAGQFFTVSARIGGRTIRRAYSASCAPGGKRCAVTVKQVSDGVMSTYLNTEVKPGARLQILGPSGAFCIPSPMSAPKNLVLIAAGSGITPVMSILRTILTETTDSRVVLIYGNRTESDIIFADALAELCARHCERLVVRHILTSPSPVWTGGIGRLDEHLLRRELSSLTFAGDAHYYICGPEGLMDGARNVLIDDGVDKSRIHQERFVRAADDLDIGDLAPQIMTVESDGAQIATLTVEPGKSLLQAGLDARVSMPYSCTVGNCGDCMVKLIEGEVRMAEPNCLTPEQRSDGYILACIGKPRSPVRIDIIDE